MEKINSDEWLKDLPIQAENIAFKPEEMIRCTKCERMNPPTKLKCIYCSAELIVTEAQNQFLKPNLRKLETWEKGFNIVLAPSQQTSDEAKAAEIAKILKMNKEVWSKFLNANASLPIARAESQKEAEIAQARLRELGIKTFIISDEILSADKPARRLRGIEFFGDKIILILFNQDEIVEIASEDLVLIVAGAVFERRIEATEKYKKTGENEILQTTEIAFDEALIDIYSRQDSFGYRIYAKGFDFSALEKEKEMLAKDNIKKLIAKLRRISPDVKLVDEYLQNRVNLASVWEVEQRTDSQGLKRESFRKYNLENTTTINNLSQFTKYSRLQWHLL